jgi:archaetidylinositol phosphate synthase
MRKHRTREPRTQHERVIDTFTGRLERKALRWLASHLPGWVTPDMLTIVSFSSAVIIAASYAFSGQVPWLLWVACAGFVINWFGDSLDGTLARYRKIERPVYGFFIDHILDAAGQVLMFLGLGMTPYIRFDVACLTLIAYFLLSVLVYVRTCVVDEFRISYGKLGPTEVRVLAILLNTAMYFFGEHSFPISLGVFGQLTFSPYDLFVIFIGLLLLYFFFTTAVQETIRLAKEGR